MFDLEERIVAQIAGGLHLKRMGVFILFKGIRGWCKA